MDIETALAEFYCRFPLTRLNVSDTYINYKTSGTDIGNAYALDQAQDIINKFVLPLKAEVLEVGRMKNVLHVSFVDPPTVYENKYCKVYHHAGSFVLHSKTGKYADKPCATIEDLAKTMGVDTTFFSQLKERLNQDY